jgi:hypothetical protein
MERVPYEICGSGRGVLISRVHPWKARRVGRVINKTDNSPAKEPGCSRGDTLSGPMAQGGLCGVGDSVPARPCLPRSGHAPGAVCPALHGGGSALVLLSFASPDHVCAVGGFCPRSVPIRSQNASGDHPYASPRRGDRPSRALPDGGAESGGEVGAAPDPATPKPCIFSE